jgi:hypothetical protein
LLGIKGGDKKKRIRGDRELYRGVTSDLVLSLPGPPPGCTSDLVGEVSSDLVEEVSRALV